MEAKKMDVIFDTTISKMHFLEWKCGGGGWGAGGNGGNDLSQIEKHGVGVVGVVLYQYISNH